MKLDRFKDLKPIDRQFQVTDIEYVKKLNELPKRTPKTQIWTVVGGIAAAVAIVTVVSLWALIGRGIRGTSSDSPVLPANQSVSVEVTDRMQSEFDKMSQDLRLFALPVFERGEAPTQKAFSDYVYYMTTDKKDDWIITAPELNELYFDTFGIKSEFITGINYDGPYSVNVSMTGTKLLSFKRSELDDGTPIITITYGEPDVSVTTLSYVPITDFEPDYFIEHTCFFTAFVKKTEKPLEEESVYKVTGALADELLTVVREAISGQDSGKCYCAPTYTIVYNEIEYRVVMGEDENMAHIVYTTGLDGTVNNVLTQSEYQRLKKALNDSINDKNFVEKKDVEYSPKDNEVKIVVEDYCEKYQAGTYTITGDDAKALIKLIDQKSYTHAKMALVTGVSLQIGEKYYTLNTDDEPFIENACGCYLLKNDTEIIPLIEKNLKNSVKTKVEDAFQTIAKNYLFDTMREFDLGTIPDLDMVYYIASYRKNVKNKQLSQYNAPNGRIIYGLPVDEYYEYMNELFGGYQPIENVTPIADVTAPKYYGIEAIKTDDGTLIIPVELSGGLDYTHYFDAAYEGEYNSQKTVTLEYRISYGDVLTDGGIQKHTVTYTTDDGVNPKHFIEHKIKQVD